MIGNSGNAILDSLDSEASDDIDNDKCGEIRGPCLTKDREPALVASAKSPPNEPHGHASSDSTVEGDGPTQR